MKNNIRKNMWVAIVFKNGARAVGRTFIASGVDGKIGIRYVGDYINSIAYLDEVESIAEITIDWESDE